MRTIALLLGGVVLGIVAYRVQIDGLLSPTDRAAATVAIGWAFLVAGLTAWSKRPANRLGPLMVLTAFALLARQLRYSHDATLFTVFFLVGDLPYALVGHTVFAYPFGRVRGRAERALVVLGYATVVVFPLAVLLVHGPTTPLLQYNPFDPRRHESLIAVVTSVHATELLQKAEVVVFYGVLATLFIALIVRKLVLASPRMRRVLAPLLVAAVAIALRAVFECVFTFADRPFAYDYLFWWQAAALIALPLALLAGLLRARLARATVGDLLIELEQTPTDGLRDALARAFGDPTLELGLWLPDRGEFVDAAGRRVALPGHDGRRALTRVDVDEGGEPLAVLIHDPSLLEEPELVRSTAAAARLALENARLQAELRAQLQAVAESRRRIATAGDEERRRIERDIHDGAQQNVFAVAVKLRHAQRQLGGKLDPEVEAVLNTAVDELQDAVEQLRDLAHGIHPTLLAEGGLGTAVSWVAARSPLDVRLDVTDRRYPAEVESVAYFVACEALLNVAKHADASTATVRVQERDGLLVVEVTDDGIGGASLNGGSGLRGLSDRVEAVGGRLAIVSPATGTSVIAEIPCAS